MSKEYSEKEARELFLDHIHNLIDYWLNEERAETTKDKMEGLAFSILTTLDGESGNMPSYELKPFNSKEDIEYLKENGENYYPENGIDIAGCLHDFFYKN